MTISDRDMGRLKALVGAVESARQRRDRLVHELRASGATWTEIGYGLGMTAQGAQKRYGSSQERAAAHKESAAARALKKRSKGA